MLAMRDYVSSLFVMSIIVFAAIIASRLAQSAEYHVSNSTIAGAFLISILAYAIICFPRLYRDAYDTPN
jgi:predicted neutral ceramidase superfamily lipid hydrolase